MSHNAIAYCWDSTAVEGCVCDGMEVGQMVEVWWCVWPCGDPTPHQTMKLTYAARPFLLKRLLCKNSAINKKQMWTWTTAVQHSTCASDSHNEGIRLIWINKKVNKHTEWTLWKMIIYHLYTQMTNNHFITIYIYIQYIFFVVAWNSRN